MQPDTNDRTGDAVPTPIAVLRYGISCIVIRPSFNPFLPHILLQFAQTSLPD